MVYHAILANFERHPPRQYTEVRARYKTFSRQVVHALGLASDDFWYGNFKRADMKALRLFWSRGHERNAGDWFSPLICERLSGRPIAYADPRRCDLVAAGSLLGRLNKSHRLHRLGFSRPLDIWGTGSLRSGDRLAGSHRLHALRGRLTLARCTGTQARPILGDPGLLAELLLDGPVAKRDRIGVIAHLADRGHPDIAAFVAATAHARILEITQPVPRLLADIAGCEAVLSSGLHGLVFADALGIPNRWFTASGALLGGRHKFDDYYSVFDLHEHPVRLPHFSPDAGFADYRRPGIESLKQNLLASFPFR